jgi:hypothetical protein
MRWTLCTLLLLICPAAAVTPFPGEISYPQSVEGVPARTYFHWLADRARVRFDMKTSDGKWDAQKISHGRYAVERNVFELHIET